MRFPFEGEAWVTMKVPPLGFHPAELLQLRADVEQERGMNSWRLRALENERKSSSTPITPTLCLSISSRPNRLASPPRSRSYKIASPPSKATTTRLRPTSTRRLH